jgi:hypothetical protein
MSTPERAGREGDQELPVRGARSVFAEVRRDLDSREAVGVRRYGRSLETFNGRDACRDLEEELLDGIVYAKQVRLEYFAVVEALLALAHEITRPRTELGLLPAGEAALELARMLQAQKQPKPSGTG